MSGFSGFADVIIITAQTDGVGTVIGKVGKCYAVKSVDTAIFYRCFPEVFAKFPPVRIASGHRRPDGCSGDIAHDAGLFKITVFQRLFAFEIDFLIDYSAVCVPRFQSYRTLIADRRNQHFAPNSTELFAVKAAPRKTVVVSGKHPVKIFCCLLVINALTAVPPAVNQIKQYRSKMVAGT